MAGSGTYLGNIMPHRSMLPYAALLVLAAVVAPAVAQELGAVHHRAGHSHHGHAVVNNCQSGFNFQFERYVPSAWEQRWQQQIEDMQDDQVCALLKREEAQIQQWLAGVEAYLHGKEPHINYDALGNQVNDEVFSSLVYKNICNHPNPDAPENTLRVWIEPLVGHLRHPRAPPACGDADVQERNYILPNAMHADEFIRQYHGRKYMFDLGSQTFGTSIKWFTDHYSRFGIEFDEFWGWEVNHVDPTEYWNNVPEAYYSKIHFYNVPANGADDSISNCFKMLSNIYKPGDFVIIKLDIDKADLEFQLLTMLDRYPHLIPMVADIYFEMHYDHPDMAIFFGMENHQVLQDVYKTFHRMRAAGVRLHYWP